METEAYNISVSAFSDTSRWRRVYILMFDAAGTRQAILSLSLSLSLCFFSEDFMLSLSV